MANFGLRYFAQLRSKYKGVFWRVEIAERDYSGPSEEMEFAGGSPLSITWENRGDEFYVPVKEIEGMSESISPLLQTNIVIHHLYIRMRLEFTLCGFRLIFKTLP